MRAQSAPSIRTSRGPRRTRLKTRIPSSQLETMPTAEERQAFIQEAVRRLRDEAGAQRVVLFGSEVEGTADRHSDVDLLVIVDSEEPHLDRWVRIRRLIAGPRQQVPFDLVVLTPDELDEKLERGDPFIQQILEGGRTLHAG